MKNVSVLVFILLIAALVVLSAVLFQVRVTEKVLVTRFGEVNRTINKPGFYWRLPVPIEKVRRFDSRAFLYSGALEETTTRGGDPVTVTSYIIWRIGDDTEKYLQSVTNKKGAETQLKSMLRNIQNSVIGRHYFSEFVNSDPSQIKLAEIENEMLESLKTEAAANYGIDIELVGIKQLGVSQEVTAKVFERMKNDRLREEADIISQGKAEAEKIRTDAERKRTELLSIVERKAEAIRGEGDADAAKYYKMLDSNPELAVYLMKLDKYKNILKDKSTYVFSADSELAELLKGVPEIKVEKKD